MAVVGYTNTLVYITVRSTSLSRRHHHHSVSNGSNVGGGTGNVSREAQRRVRAVHMAHMRYTGSGKCLLHVVGVKCKSRTKNTKRSQKKGNNM